MKNLKLEIIQTKKDYQILSIISSGNGIIDSKYLADLKLPENHDKRKGIVLYGKAPIWLYAFLVHECHSFAWVATFDPRIGGIIVQSHSNNGRQVGDIICSDDIINCISKPTKDTKPSPLSDNSHRVIAFVGPPHSGKSVLMQKIREELSTHINFQDEFFIIRACPDGEGNWSGEVPADISNEIREKKVFDDDFPSASAEQIIAVSKQKKLVLVDCGGIIDKKNQIILNACNSAIIVSSNKEAVSEWIGACKTSELKIHAVVDSVLEDCSECLQLQPLRCKIGKLERNNLAGLSLPNELITSFRDIM